ncbi:unnamed protein product [Bursaphelenchus xylophilus]|uniref:(pine wood nematode) hypothetical protein n=1 Tax=Bursaphelenchus xylophilus TaxID=6326 RepID=A0A1I7S9T8_BURXY|nr:unnamed protein product [Bursaphelenchus xylophilus]CAG9129231.1 unnamed protein product [Bursaphelenchus xylophilus]
MTQNAKTKTPKFKLIIRRLPRELTEEDLKEQLSPLDDHEAFWFRPSNKDLMPWAFSRAYIVFNDIEKAQEFKNKFHGYVFVDKMGFESKAIVEMAFHQEVPSSFPQDAMTSDKRTNTLESRPDYQEFLAVYETTTVVKKVTDFDELIKEVENKEKLLEAGQIQQTPLTDFMIKQHLEKEKKRRARREKHSPYAAIEEEKKPETTKKTRAEAWKEKKEKERKEPRKDREEKERPVKTPEDKEKVKKDKPEPREKVKHEKERKNRRKEKDGNEKEDRKPIKLLTKDKNNEDVITEVQKVPVDEKERLPSALVPDPSVVGERTAKSGEPKEKKERPRRPHRPEREVYRPARARQNKEKPQE